MTRRLLEDDHEWRICLEEAIAMQSRMTYYWLLAVILLTDEVAEPHLLWDQFKTGLCDDVKHKLYHMNHYQADQKIPKGDVYDYGLWDLNRILYCSMKSDRDWGSNPDPSGTAPDALPLSYQVLQGIAM